MKLHTFFAILVLTIKIGFGQTIFDPNYEKCDVSSLKILKIEFTPPTTKISLNYTSSYTFENGGWVCIGKDTYLMDSFSKKKYKLLFAYDIPVCPKAHIFKYKGQELEFNLEFEPIPIGTKKIDFIEDESKKGFNFYGLNLQMERDTLFKENTLKLKSQARMHKLPDPLSDVIFTISPNQYIKVLSIDGGYYKVRYNNTIGYINEICFELKATFSINNKQNNDNSTTISAPNNNQNKERNKFVDCDQISIIPASQKPTFDNYLEGIKNVIIVPVDWDSPNENRNYRYHLLSKHTVMHRAIEEYFNDIGFEKTIFIENDSELNDYDTDINTFVSIVFGLDILKSKPYSNIMMVFLDPKSGYSWNFQSSNTAESSVYSIKSVFKGMYGKKKRYFNSSSVVQLQKHQTCWTENKIIEAFQNEGCNFTEGIYESTSRSSYNSKYKIAVREINGKYYIIYLSGAGNKYNWNEGEIKAYLERTSTADFYKSIWILANKEANEDYYISFEAGLMNVIDPTGEKTIYIKLYPSNTDDVRNREITTSGSGFAISETGYIVTNYHVIKGAQTINVRGINGDFSQTFPAQIIIEDKNNDLAIIKIDDLSKINPIPYVINSRASDVGTGVFVLGFPLRATMGDEIKLTDGILSSKSGYQGDITTYQISAPVQPGNSGGPLFDRNGNLIGVINAKLVGAENASYAVKSSYLINLIDLLPEKIILTSTNVLMGKPLTEQVKLLKGYTYIIEVN